MDYWLRSVWNDGINYIRPEMTRWIFFSLSFRPDQFWETGFEECSINDVNFGVLGRWKCNEVNTNDWLENETLEKKVSNGIRWHWRPWRNDKDFDWQRKQIKTLESLTFPLTSDWFLIFHEIWWLRKLINLKTKFPMTSFPQHSPIYTRKNFTD